MASYDYQCPECKQISEVEHGMDDKPEVYCTACSTEDEKVIMKRIINVPNIKFTDSFRFGRIKDNKDIAGLKEKIQSGEERDPYERYREDPDRDLKIR